MTLAIHKMKPEMIKLLKDLADVLERHAGGLTCTTAENGIYVTVGDDWNAKVCIDWPHNGNVSRIWEIIEANSAQTL